MKRKLITTAVSLLLCLGVVGSGFAAWVISRTTTEEVEGNFAVETIKEAKVDITSATVATDSNAGIVFGAPTEDDLEQLGDDATIWFDYQSGTAATNLTVTVDIVISNVNEWMSDYDYKLSFAVTGKEDADVTAYDAAISDGYIAAPTFTLAESQGTITDNAMTLDASKKNESNQITLTLTVTFAWGSAFGGKNPYVYYNNQEYSDTLANGAVDAIQAFDDLNGVNYKLVITGTATKKSAAQS